MKHLEYLSSILPGDGGRFPRFLKEMLISKSLNIGVPYDENVNLLLSKYKKRVLLSKRFRGDVLGLDELVNKLSSYSLDHKVKVYPLKNDFYTGDCLIANDQIIGFAFTKRGRAVSKKGLWINGSEVD